MNLITPTEAATRLRIPQSTLAHYRCNGKGPEFFKIGRRVFYSDEALERWLRKHSFRSTAEATEQPS